MNQALTDPTKASPALLALKQRDEWAKYTQAVDLAGVLMARAHDAMASALSLQPDPSCPIESMRIDDAAAPEIAQGFEPAIQQAMAQLNEAYECLFVVAGDALSECMQAVAQEIRDLQRGSDAGG